MLAPCLPHRYRLMHEALVLDLPKSELGVAVAGIACHVHAVTHPDI